ncbi:MAG: hypothetical protein HQ556_14170 [Candidatus Marinimicrobia bacterium]|nr:hypothetical protein [Candidatus Neomarinimicrobiota bacterium]
MKSKTILFVILISLMPALVKAESRKLIGPVFGFMIDHSNDSTLYGAGASSKYEVINTTETHYVVKFISIAPYSANLNSLTMMIVNSKAVNSIPTVKFNAIYRIKKIDLPSYFHEFNAGVVTGVLSVPFKLLYDGTISPGATLGIYAGYKYKSYTALISGGFATIPTSTISSDKIDTDMGLTGAIGLLIEPKDQLQLGVIYGFDHLGQEWKYEDKGWFSLAIGYSFTQ